MSNTSDQPKLSLAQFTDNIINEYYQSEYGQIFKYLLSFDADNYQFVIPIDMLIHLAGMRPIRNSQMNQKLVDFGLVNQMDFIEKNSVYLLTYEAFIRCLKRTDEGAVLVATYQSFLEMSVYHYLNYEKDYLDISSDQSECDSSDNDDDSYQLSQHGQRLFDFKCNRIDDNLVNTRALLTKLDERISAIESSVRLGVGALIVVAVCSIASLSINDIWLTLGLNSL